MRHSQLFAPTRKEAPKDETSLNAILLSRGGYIDKTSAGVYSFLPLGLRVIQKISAIVREEMNALPGVQEMLMPALQPKDLWIESGRYEAARADVMYTLEEEGLALGPTHEEIVTDIFRRYYNSYKQLPLTVYQIQTKFRREMRAKSGLLRGREFLMKDLYSFHTTEEGLSEFYESTKPAYLRIYERCGLPAVITMASGGIFSKYSEEFQMVSPVGEDTIYLNAAGDYARNQEIIADATEEEKAEFSRTESAIEIGNIFKMNHKISGPLGATVLNEAGERVTVYMGCYGIGISRMMGALVEKYGEEKGKIVWPENVAPFKVHLLDLLLDGQAEQLYKQLVANGIEVLWDEREKTAGEKFAEADLIGAPIRLVVSKRSLEQGGVEFMRLADGEKSVVALEKVIHLC